MQLHYIFSIVIPFIKHLSYVDNEKKKEVSFHLEIEIGLCNFLHNFHFLWKLGKSIESNRIEKSSNQLINVHPLK